jgi:pimeloyl-ACP methyl ester carboxylesterase
MHKRFLKYNKGKLLYQIQGEEDPIVFIHGFTLDHRMWEKQVDYFSKNYQVITYDMRGFGKSSVPTNAYSHHEDFKALLKLLKMKKAHVVGLSLGGEVAIDFTIEYPNSVITLTLLDSSLGGYNSTVNWDVKAKGSGIDKAKKNWMNHAVFDKTRSSNCWSKVGAIVKDYSGWHWINDDPRKKLDPSAKERLNEIKTPTLIAVGKDDLSYFHDIAKYIHDNVENSTLHVIKDAGHMVNMEKPLEVNRRIEKHIST